MVSDGAEIVDDSVSVMTGQRVTRRFREIEVELVDGDERSLERLAKELRRAGASPSDELRPKLYRALDLAFPLHPRSRLGERRRALRSGSPSESRCGACSATTRVSASAPTPRTSTSFVWRPAGCARSSARAGTCSTFRGRSRCATSFAGWAARSARPGISTC